MNLLRLKYLIKKEIEQINKDKSILIIAFVVPFLLILIYGYGMSMDIKPVKAALVCENNATLTSFLQSRLQGSDYLEIKSVFTHQEGEDLLNRHKIDAIVDIKSNLKSKKDLSDNEILITIDGSSGIFGITAQSYLQQAISQTLSAYNKTNSQAKAVELISRNWFNEANISNRYILPGQSVGIITLVGAFMCSLVIAREINRGTFESLIASNVTAFEIMLSKTVPYFFMSLWGSFLTLILIELLFAIPIRGSITFLILTVSAYTLSSTALGLFISALMKDQFLATEYAILLSFLPAILLSGSLFDLRSVPDFIAFIGYMIPPTYAVESFRICFLSGGNTDTLLINLLIIIFYVVFFSALTVLLLKRGGIKGGKHV